MLRQQCFWVEMICLYEVIQTIEDIKEKLENLQKLQGWGNFIKLLNFRDDAGDLILKEHLSAPKNSTYISKTTQNKLIECCGNAIEEILINDIKKSKYFSIMADKASDCAMLEQFSIVIRYVDLNGSIKEVFLLFFECKTGTSGLNMATNIIETLKEFSVDIKNCRGQSYDGAASTSDEYKGVSSLLKKLILWHYLSAVPT